MVYTRYIKRNGKKLGPYYYTSVRGKNGRVKSVYLGKDLKVVTEKEKKLLKRARDQSTRAPVRSPPLKLESRFSRVKFTASQLHFFLVVALLIAALTVPVLLQVQVDAPNTFTDLRRPITGFVSVGGLSISGTGCDYLTGWDYPNWTINVSQTCLASHENITLEGNLTVNGVLRFENVTLRTNGTSVGDPFIRVNGSGTFTMNASSNLTNSSTGTYYLFTINGSFEANDSFIDRTHGGVNIYGNFANFTNVTFTNPNGYGLAFNGTMGGRVVDSALFSSGAASAYLVSIVGGATGVNISNNTLTTNTTSSHGLLISGATTLGSYVGQNTFNGNGSSTIGFALSSLTGNTTIINNTFNGTYRTANIVASNNLTIRDNLIIVDGASPAHAHAVLITGASRYNLFAGNSILVLGTTGQNTNGMRMFNDGDNVGAFNNTIIENNTITVNSPASGGLSDGILMTDTDSYLFSIRNNTIRSVENGLFIAGGNHTIDENTVVTGSGAASYGVYVHANSDVGISVTNNNVTTVRASAYGLRIDKALLNLSGNTITTSGSSAYGIYLLQTVSSPMQNNIVNTSGSTAYGIYLGTSANANTLSYSRINTSGSSASGIYLDGDAIDDIVLINNSIETSGSSGHGIYLNGADFVNITDGTIRVVGPSANALYLTASTDTRVLNTTIDSSGNYAILLDGASINTTVINSTLISNITVGRDVSMESGTTGNVTLANVSVNQSKIIFESNTGSANVSLEWFLQVNVQETSSAAGISGAEVIIRNASGSLVFNGTTGVNGILVSQPLRDTLFTLAQNTTNVSYRVNVSYSNVSYMETTNDSSINLTSSQTVIAKFTLNATSDPDPGLAPAPVSSSASASPTGQLPNYIITLPSVLTVELQDVVSTASFTVDVTNPENTPLNAVSVVLTGLPVGVTYVVSPLSTDILGEAQQTFLVTLHIALDAGAGTYPLQIITRTPERILSTSETVLSVYTIGSKPAESSTPAVDDFSSDLSGRESSTSRRTATILVVSVSFVLLFVGMVSYFLKGSGFFLPLTKV